MTLLPEIVRVERPLFWQPQAEDPCAVHTQWRHIPGCWMETETLLFWAKRRQETGLAYAAQYSAQPSGRVNLDWGSRLSFNLAKSTGERMQIPPVRGL